MSKVSASLLRSVRQRVNTLLSSTAVTQRSEPKRIDATSHTKPLKNQFISSIFAKHPGLSSLLSAAPVVGTINPETMKLPDATSLPPATQVSDAAQLLPIEDVQRVLCMIHECSGLPWWAALVIAAVSFRTLVVPFSLLRMRATASLVRLMPYIMTQLRVAGTLQGQRRGLVQRPEPLQRLVPLFLRAYRKRSKEYGVSIWRIFSPLLVSVPLFVTFNSAVRRMLAKHEGQVAVDEALKAAGQFDAELAAAAAHVPSGAPLSAWTQEAVARAATLLTTEGPWFCPNLTLPDPNFVFPGIAIVVTMLNVYATFHSFSDLRNQLSSKVSVNVESLRPSKMPYLMLAVQGLVLMVIPLASWMPAYTFLYWNTVMAYSALQNVVLKAPAVRRFCGFEAPHHKVAADNLSFLHEPAAPVVVALPPLSGRAVSTARVAHTALLRDARNDEDLMRRGRDLLERKRAGTLEESELTPSERFALASAEAEAQEARELEAQRLSAEASAAQAIGLI